MGETIGLVSPALFRVRWGCRRCGHRNGVARTTAPIVGDDTPPEIVRALLDELRRKLVKVHMKTGCIATPDDFVIDRSSGDDVPIVGLV